MDVSDAQKLRGLEAENAKLKRLLAEEVMDKPEGFNDSEGPPFDLAKAHALYTALFGQVEDLLKNADGSWKHLLIVPSGPLTQLPFQVLLTGKSGFPNLYDN